MDGVRGTARAPGGCLCGRAERWKQKRYRMKVEKEKEPQCAASRTPGQRESERERESGDLRCKMKNVRGGNTRQPEKGVNVRPSGNHLWNTLPPDILSPFSLSSPISQHIFLNGHNCGLIRLIVVAHFIPLTFICLFFYLCCSPFILFILNSVL